MSREVDVPFGYRVIEERTQGMNLHETCTARLEKHLGKGKWDLLALGHGPTKLRARLNLSKDIADRDLLHLLNRRPTK